MGVQAESVWLFHRDAVKRGRLQLTAHSLPGCLYDDAVRWATQPVCASMCAHLLTMGITVIVQTALTRITDELLRSYDSDIL